MNIDPTLKACFDIALSMTLSRKSTKIAVICDIFDYVPMLKRIEVHEEKKNFLELATRFEVAVNEVLTGVNDSSVAEHYELDLETLRNEIHRFRNSGAELYENNETGRIFSFKEELMLLEVLAMIPHSHCTCQTCTLERLPYLAYYMARQKGKSYPCEWDENQQAGKEWQANFKIEYEYEISNSFPTKCTLEQATK